MIINFKINKKNVNVYFVLIFIFKFNFIGVCQKNINYDETSIIPCQYIDFVFPNEIKYKIDFNLSTLYNIKSIDYKEERYNGLIIYKVPIFYLFENWIVSNENNIVLNKNLISKNKDKYLKDLYLNFLVKETISLYDKKFESLNDTLSLKSYLLSPKFIYDFTLRAIDVLEKNIDSSKYYWTYSYKSTDEKCIIGYDKKYKYSTSHTSPYNFDYDVTKKDFICLTDQLTNEKKWIEISETKEFLTDEGKILTFKKDFLEIKLLKQLKTLLSFCDFFDKTPLRSIYKE